MRATSSSIRDTGLALRASVAWLVLIGLVASPRVQAEPQGSLQVCATPEVHASDPEASDYFGTSIAQDGDTFVAGARAGSTGDPTPEPGTAYVFRRVAGSWTEEARLVPSDGQAGDRFGKSVALEGDVLAVASLTGVYRFTRSGGLWTEQQKLTTPDPSLDVDYGASLALSGNWLAVGDPGLRDAQGVLHGALYLYETQAGAWTLRQRILGAGSRYFARSLDLEGDALAVGAIAAWGHIVIPGEAYVLRRDALGQWNLEAAFTPTVLETGFGAAVALDGERAAVGSAGPGSGSVWLYARAVGVWTEESHFASPVSGGNSFGSDLGLRGSRLLVGEPNLAAGPPDQWGRAWVFERIASVWVQTGSILPSEPGPVSGVGGVMDFDGTWLLLGVASDDDFGAGSGAAWPYLLATAPSSYCTAKVNSQGCTPSIGFTGLPSAGGVDDFHVTATDVLNRRPGILLWSLVPDAAPFLGGTLCLRAPVVRTQVQVATGTPPPAVDCTGTYDFHFGHAYIAAQSLAPGTEVFAQYWSRDQGLAAPTNVGLTDALRFVVCL